MPEQPMSDYPNLHTIVLYTRGGPVVKADWNRPEANHIRRIRSSHTRREGDIVKSYYTVETTTHTIRTLVYDQKELCWYITAPDSDQISPVHFVLAHSKASTNVPSFDHRLIPYRFLCLKKPSSAATTPTLIDRMQPFRFLKGRHSMQANHIRCRHTEDLRTTRHLHYVVKTDQNRHFNLVYVCSQAIWKFIQEVDGVLLFDE